MDFCCPHRKNHFPNLLSLASGGRILSQICGLLFPLGESFRKTVGYCSGKEIHFPKMWALTSSGKIISQNGFLLLRRMVIVGNAWVARVLVLLLPIARGQGDCLCTGNLINILQMIRYRVRQSASWRRAMRGQLD